MSNETLTTPQPPVSLQAGALHRPRLWGPMALVVGLFVVAGHIWSIDTGLFLDDHAHFAHLKEADWSLRGAVEASRLGIVGDVMDLWGRHEAGLRFFRPVAFWTMKAEYTIANWRPMPMHFFSLAWHFACAMLVGALAMRCFGRRIWAVVAASLMAIHPGHTATVYWIACQTELLTTALLLVGILAYGHASGWWRGGAVFCRASVGSAPAEGSSYRTLAGAVAVACYALALGCRENAILLPVVCWAGDVLLGSRSWRRIRWEYVAMGVVLVAYMVMRSLLLGGFPMPARPYILRPSDPGFAGFILDKIVYYTLGLFGYVPVIPMGGQAYFAGRPLSFYGGFGLTLGILTIIWSAYGIRRSLLWPVVWIACLIAPVLPVFASSHHLYLPGVGAVLLLTAGLAAMGGGLLPDGVPLPRPRAIVTGLVLLLHAVGLGLFTWGSGFAYRAGTLTEDILIDDVLQRGEALRDGDHLFFINLPLLAYYVVPAIESRTGLRDLHGHVLTFSPWLLRMESPGAVEIPDEHRLIVHSPADTPYFEGVTGRTLLEAMGFGGMPEEGQAIRVEQYGFTVTPQTVDRNGMRRIEFRFDESIRWPRYHFYFGSPQFLAYPLLHAGPTSRPSAP